MKRICANAGAVWFFSPVGSSNLPPRTKRRSDVRTVSSRSHLPVRKNLYAKEGLCGHLARLRLLASGDPVERIGSFFGGPGDDVPEFDYSSFYVTTGTGKPAGGLITPEPTAPTLYYVFDVLWSDGEDIITDDVDGYLFRTVRRSCFAWPMGRELRMSETEVEAPK